MDTNYENWPRSELIKKIDDLQAEIDNLQDAKSRSALIEIVDAFKLTQSEGRILLCLADGFTHSKNSIFSALYWDRPGDPPEMKIIDVFMTKVRKKISASGMEIRNIHGKGFRLLNNSILQSVLKGELPDFASGNPPPLPSEVRRRNGENLKNVMEEIRKIMNKNCEARFSARTLAVKANLKVLLAPVLYMLERKGFIKIRHHPRRGTKQDWVVFVRSNSRVP